MRGKSDVSAGPTPSPRAENIVTTVELFTRARPGSKTEREGEKKLRSGREGYNETSQSRGSVLRERRVCVCILAGGTIEVWKSYRDERMMLPFLSIRVTGIRGGRRNRYEKELCNEGVFSLYMEFGFRE